MGQFFQPPGRLGLYHLAEAFLVEGECSGGRAAGRNGGAGGDIAGAGIRIAGGSAVTTIIAAAGGCRLRGRSVDDGVTPCQFLGYQFKNGNTSYTVLDSGRLLVEQNGKTLEWGMEL